MSKELLFIKKFECYHRHGCGVTVILMSRVSICPEFFACVTGTDVLNKVSISDGYDGGACVQQDPIGIDDVSLWYVGCCLSHYQSKLQ